jgi:hypothetical protein
MSTILPTVRVCALLGTTYITDVDEPTEKDNDHWMTIDFVALHHLIGAPDGLSKWLCGTTIRTNRGFFMGDPAGDRIVFDPPPFETVFSGQPSDLVLKYTTEVAKASSLLSAGDTLVLVLVGHGDKDDDHSFFVGYDCDSCFRLKKDHLEDCVRGTKGDILLISTACFSGSWKSQYWTLLAAAGADQEAPLIAASGSNEYRGFFTNALLAEYADEFKIRPPYPGLVDETGQQAEQKEHDFGPTKTTRPSPYFPSLQAILNWIHQFRDDIGRTYPSADVIFHPCSSKPHKLPFVSLITARAPFHRLECIPPSPPDDASSESSHVTANVRCPATPSLPPQNISVEPSATWSASDEAELVELAADFLLYMPPTITSERSPIIGCMNMIYGNRGCEPFSPVKKRKLLSQLKKRECHRQLALAIAKNLGWEKAVQDIGGPGGKQRQMTTRADLRRQAEASGCLVSVLLIPEGSLHSEWAGAAGWLARVWEAAGCPIVSPDEWQMAIQQSR